jgi:ABC-type cobalamin/Fe3+-siderophores transport system ATPase subunit
MGEVLEIRDLRVKVEDKEILKGVDLTVQQGEVHALMGPNGSGKSTLAYSIMGHPGYEVTGGTIELNGENIAEWGPGVFGAEAAARYHFGKSAATLTPSQAALLAVSLPNPIERRAGAPGPGTQRLANTIHARMMASPGNASCVQARR